MRVNYIIYPFVSMFSSPCRNSWQGLLLIIAVKKQEVFIMGIFDTIQEESTFSRGSGISYQYVVLQVTLKEKFIGTGSGNLTELEKVINEQAAKGYRLHTISTTSSGSKGLMGGDRIQATMVFEKLG